MARNRQRDEALEVTRRLARDAHVEVIPLKGVEGTLRVIPVATTVTITMSPRFGLERTLEKTEAARRAGYEVVPHLAARQVRDKAELAGIVKRLEDAGVRHLYVIGGDVADPAGDYASAGQLLADLADLEHGIGRVGVACYPEGHPRISGEALLRALCAKQPLAHYMVSQLCFDARALVAWLRGARAAGVRLPLRIGLAAPLQARKLMELSVKVGVGSSLRYLAKQHGFVRTLLSGSAYRPEKLLYEIGADLGSPELAIEGLHLFSFNQVAATVEWQRRIAGSPAGRT
jgi:methylenetetrahydrofolate reductase (NADPH)